MLFKIFHAVIAVGFASRLGFNELPSPSSVITTDPSLSIYSEWIEGTDILFRMDESRGATFLIPNDSAYNALYQNGSDIELIDHDTKLQILYYCMIPYAVNFTTLVPGDHTFESIQSALIFANVDSSGDIKINSSARIVNTVHTPMGIVHIIDKVLFPSNVKLPPSFPAEHTQEGTLLPVLHTSEAAPKRATHTLGTGALISTAMFLPNTTASENNATKGVQADSFKHSYVVEDLPFKRNVGFLHMQGNGLSESTLRSTRAVPPVYTEIFDEPKVGVIELSESAQSISSSESKRTRNGMYKSSVRTRNWSKD